MEYVFPHRDGRKVNKRRVETDAGERTIVLTYAGTAIESWKRQF